MAWLYCYALWFTVFLLRHCLSICFGCPALYWWLWVVLSSNYFRCGEGHGRESCKHTMSGFSRHTPSFFFKICGTTHILTENMRRRGKNGKIMQRMLCFTIAIFSCFSCERQYLCKVYTGHERFIVVYCRKRVDLHRNFKKTIKCLMINT